MSGLLADDITADCVSSGRVAKVGYSMAARACCCQPLRALFMYLFTLWRGPGLEDRPSNFGLPQRLVSGIGGGDEVALTNRPVDRERMLRHICGEGT